MLEGGAFCGKYFGHGTQPAMASSGMESSKEAIERTAKVTGCSVTGSVLRAVWLTVFASCLQQLCEAGMSMTCPQSLFIMRQHARSSVVISAFGAMHAIAGPTRDTSKSRSAPSWRIDFTP